MGKWRRSGLLAATSSVGKPKGHLLRKGRHSLTGQIYSVTSVTFKRERVFHDFYLSRIVVQAMRYHEFAGNAETFAFVVMPDHFHWLFTLNGQMTLARLVGSVKGYSANCIQKIRREREMIDAVHPLWQEGYHDHALRQEEDVKSVARYIIGNPLRAGLVENIGDYSLWDVRWMG